MAEQLKSRGQGVWHVIFLMFLVSLGIVTYITRDVRDWDDEPQREPDAGALQKDPAPISVAGGLMALDQALGRSQVPAPVAPPGEKPPRIPTAR